MHAVRSKELSAEVTFVGSDNADAKGLATAESLGITIKVFPYNKGRRNEAEEAIAREIEKTETDWLILAGFMRILSPEFVRRFPNRIINIHPSLLPSFPGAHGIKDAWEAGVGHTGVTVHIVDEEVDHGCILAQERVDINEDDTMETLENKIHLVEHRLYKETLKSHFQSDPEQQ